MKKNIGRTTVRLGDKREKKKTENTVGEDSLGNTLLGDYTDGQMQSMTDSTGRDWKEIGDDGRRRDRQTKERED